MGRVPARVALRSTALAVLVVLTGTAAPALQEEAAATLAARQALMAAPRPETLNRLPAAIPATQSSPPPASGANIPYQLNHTFDAEIVTLGGSPSNYTFETAASGVGTPPSNFDFATGDFTDWTTAGSATIGSDAPQGSHARVANSGSSATSAAFTVDATAQFGTIKVKGWSIANDQGYVDVLSGAEFATVTNVWLGAAADAAWTTLRFNVVAWRGQQVKVRVRGQA